MSNIPVSKVTPDFQNLYNELYQKLSQKQTWVDMLPTSVGTTIADLFAGASVSNQLYLDIAFREAFLPTAVRDSSIYAGSRMLGINIIRKTPAGCTTSITNESDDTKFIVPYTKFDINGRLFYCRDQYTVPPNQTIGNVDLYSGEVKYKEFDLSLYDSLYLKEFNLSEPGFVVSSVDTLVYTESIHNGVTTVWSSTDKAIFEHSATDSVFYESTTRDGDASFLFGDGQYGKALDKFSILKIRYVVTDGREGNKGLPGIAVKSLMDSTNVTGLTTTSINGGSDEKSALYYKIFAPNMFRTKRRVISEVDFRSTIISYPGIADVKCTGQRDIAPSDIRWMNTVRVCILPEEQDSWGGANPNPSSAQWIQFLEWLRPKVHHAYTIQTWNPIKVYVTVRAKVAINPEVSANSIKLSATDNVLKLFVKKPGILGRRLSQSDIVDAIRVVDGVDYVEVESPEEDIILPDFNRYIILDGEPALNIVYSERALGVKGAYS